MRKAKVAHFTLTTAKGDKLSAIFAVKARTDEEARKEALRSMGEKAPNIKGAITKRIKAELEIL